jgi:hypothetical protein
VSDDQAPDLAAVRPLLPEYEAAVRQLFFDTVHTFMRAQDPVLDKFRAETVGHLPETSVPPDVALGGHSGPMPVSIRARLSREQVITLDTDAWVAAAWDAATGALDQLMPQFFAGLDRVLELSGRVSNAGGKPFSWDAVLDELEMLEIEFDEKGRPNEPTIVCGPELAAKMRSLPITPEQNKRWAEIIARKREEFNARRRHRKLD